jgi:hypothetical protein
VLAVLLGGGGVRPVDKDPGQRRSQSLIDAQQIDQYLQFVPRHCSILVSAGWLASGGSHRLFPVS